MLLSCFLKHICTQCLLIQSERFIFGPFYVSVSLLCWVCIFSNVGITVICCLCVQHFGQWQLFVKVLCKCNSIQSEVSSDLMQHRLLLVHPSAHSITIYHYLKNLGEMTFTFPFGTKCFWTELKKDQECKWGNFHINLTILLINALEFI